MCINIFCFWNINHKIFGKNQNYWMFRRESRRKTAVNVIRRQPDYDSGSCNLPWKKKPDHCFVSHPVEKNTLITYLLTNSKELSCSPRLLIRTKLRRPMTLECFTWAYLKLWRMVRRKLKSNLSPSKLRVTILAILIQTDPLFRAPPCRGAFFVHQSEPN